MSLGRVFIAAALHAIYVILNDITTDTDTDTDIDIDVDTDIDIDTDIDTDTDNRVLWHPRESTRHAA